MKRTTIAAVSAALLLALTGCAGNPSGADESDSDATPTSVESAAPLTAESSTPSAEPDAADAGFLQYIDEELPPATSIANATDEQLIAAGHDACEQAAAGVAWEDIRLVDGEEPTANGDYLDSSAILNGALYNYCPELIPAVD